MKVLFIVAWYYPAKVGGVARMMHNLAKELVKQGCDVTVWTTDYLNGRDYPIKKIEKKFDVIDGVKVYYFKSYFHAFQAKTKQTISIELFSKVASDEINNFDVIHLFESRSLSIGIIMMLLRFKGKTNIFHSAYGALGKENLSLKYKLYDKFILKPFLNNNCKIFFAQTKHEKDVYKRFLNKNNFHKIKILPLATNVSYNQQMAVKYKGLLKQILNIPNDWTLLIFLGRLTKNKGIERLIESFKLADPKKNKLYLAVVGYDEGLKANLESKIFKLNLEKFCRILDPVYGDERFGYYYDSDIYVITSTFYEETSLASVEALSVGTPVIVTPEVESPYIGEYKAGILAKSNNYSIAESILKSKNNISQMKKNALKLANDVYDISKVIKKLKNYYERL